MNLDNARTELASIITAIGEYVSGTRRKRFKVLQDGMVREIEFADSDKLFAYLTTRRAELESFITALEATTPSTNTFVQNKNVPLVFRR